ncbi:MAG TPA: virulence factor family protein, partial [Marinobacter sp.]|nr:virulence factor family protein [Marinobacter sp.]
MKRLYLISTFILLLVVVAGCQQPPVMVIKAGRMGEIAYLAPESEPTGVVFLFSGADGWNADLDDVAEAWQNKGAIVLKVPLPGYLEALRASADGCHYLISEIEDTSKRIQKTLGTRRYHAPILAGTGMGATLVYGALAQSPASTVEGAFSNGLPTRLDTRVPLCAGAPSTPATGGGFTYSPVTSLNGWWQMMPNAGQLKQARAFASKVNGARLIDEPEPPDSTMVERFDRLSEGKLAPPDNLGQVIANLPLVELPVKNEGTLMAVIWSGDGGWRDLDKTIGERLQSEGIPVVGVDSLRYFWRDRTPLEIGSDLAVILRHYQKVWKRQHIVLIGYSFGADVMPFAVNKLPMDLQDTIVRISLLGLAKETVFGIHIADRLLNRESEDELPVLPEVAKLDLQKVQCF